MGLFDWLFKKKGDEIFEEEVKKSFSNVKKDISKVSKWISHFHDKHRDHEEDFSKVLSRLEKLEKDLEDVKNFVEFFVAENTSGPFKSPFKHLSKHPQTPVQTGGVQPPVQTVVQTPVQTGALKGLTTMERIVLFALLNSKEKLSYEDISLITGKDKSTVRGQINNVKQKNEGLISEVMESSGKKRYFIEERVKERLLDDIILSRKTKERKERGRGIEPIQEKNPKKSKK